MEPVVGPFFANCIIVFQIKQISSMNVPEPNNENPDGFRFVEDGD